MASPAPGTIPVDLRFPQARAADERAFAGAAAREPVPAREDVRLRIEADNAAVGVEDGIIVPAGGRFETVLRFPGCQVHPGLINAHDHLHRNHYGRLGTPPYASARAWREDVEQTSGRWISRRNKVPRRDALLQGAWKNLVAGVTTVVHHDAWESEFDADFPLRVAPVPSIDSLSCESDLAAALAGDGPFAIHLAEGTDAAAADEVRRLDRMGGVSARLLAVHAVGAEDDGVRRLRAAGAAVVWCPSSNLFLFGRTAPAALLASGIDVLLGSESLQSGAGSLLDEVREARALGLLSDERLLDAVGATAARRLGIEAPSLREGARADLAVFRCAPLEARTQDVRLVVAGGVARVADAESGLKLERAGARGVLRRFGRVDRWIDQRSAAPAPRQARSA